MMMIVTRLMKMIIKMMIYKKNKINNLKNRMNNSYKKYKMDLHHFAGSGSEIFSYGTGFRSEPSSFKNLKIKISLLN